MPLDVITIGTATRDAFVKSSAFKVVSVSGPSTQKLISTPLGSKVEIEELSFTTGGGATNAAVTFARQGFKVGTVARVGDDPGGEEIRRNLHREGVDISRITVDRKNRTAYSVILSHVSGERSILVYHGASQHMTPKDLHLKPLDAKWFYISSLSGNFAMLEELLNIAKKHRIKVAYNPGLSELKSPIRLLPFLHSIDVLIMNREEGALFTGVPVENELAIFKRIDEIEPGIFVLTNGPHGVRVSDGKKMYTAGTYHEKVVRDRTGAGDAFGSGFVAGLMHRMGKGSGTVQTLTSADISYAICLGSANATAKIEGIGAKYGLLTKHDFETSVRWSNLPMEITKIL